MAKLYVLFNFVNLKFKLMMGEGNLVLYKTSSSLYWVSFFFFYIYTELDSGEIL